MEKFIRTWVAFELEGSVHFKGLCFLFAAKKVVFKFVISRVCY